MRKVIFAPGEFYHIYNRGVDKRIIILDKYDQRRFNVSLSEFNSLELTKSISRKFYQNEFSINDTEKIPLVDIVCYAIMPNHFHLLLKENVEKGIQQYMHRLGTGYTNYFNEKYHRSGSLFQGPFKAIHIPSNSYLLHLSGYINYNNIVHGFKTKSANSLWKTSIEEYTQNSRTNIINPEIITSQFDDLPQYLKFARKSAQLTFETRAMLQDDIKMEN